MPAVHPKSPDAAGVAAAAMARHRHDPHELLQMPREVQEACGGIAPEAIDTPAINAERRALLQMLFVEGNHFCPSCEKSGDCKLQSTAYDLVTMCNLIVSTTHNNQAMNEAIRHVAKRYLSGHKLTEGLLNHIEVAIRAFDPCLSCATHALGQMAIEVALVGADGEELDRLARHGDGTVSRAPS